MVPLLSALAFAQLTGVAVAQPKDPYAPAPAPAPKTPAPAPKAPAPTTAPADPYAPAPKAPADPYGTPTTNPTPAPTPPAAPLSPQEAVLAEQVATALVQRAQELFDAKVFTDAKQLAVEALQKSPKGGAAEHARFLIKKINEQLGIKDDPPAPKIEDKVDLTPIEDPTLAKQKKVDTAPEVPTPRSSRLPASIHSGAYFALVGATIGSFFDGDNPAGGAIPVGLAAGLAGGVYFPRVFDRLKWSEAQVRVAGSGTVWGGIIGGLFADVAKVSKPSEGVSGSTGSQILVGAAVGATVGGAGATFLARKNEYTLGDVALVDTFGGIGAVGGLTIGMLMQPAETEAYSLNAVFGAAAGVVVGLVAAPKTNSSQQRMLRVAGLSAAGGAVPFLLYAGIRDTSTKADERVVGLLSSAGLVAGAWLGFRLTRGMAGEDVVLENGKKKKSADDAPPSILSRSSTGRWNLGYLSVQPLSPELAPQRGMSVPLLGGAW